MSKSKGQASLGIDIVQMAKQNKESAITASILLYAAFYVVMGIGGISFQAQPALSYVVSSSNSNPVAGEVWVEGTELHWADGSTEHYTQVSKIGQAGITTGMSGNSWYGISIDSANYEHLPVILATTQTTNGGQDPSQAHIRDVSRSNFDHQHCEWDSSDSCDGHADEEQAWLALDHQKVTEDVSGMQAGFNVMQSNSGGNMQTVSFPKSFSNTPLVFAAPITANGEPPINVQIDNVGTSSFDMEFCEQEGTDSCDSHWDEKFAWLAIDPQVANKGSVYDWGTVSVSDSNWNSVSFSQSYSSAPAVFVMTQQADSGGQESIYSEANSVTSSGADVRYCESDGGDSCDTHATQEVAWLSVAPGTLTTRGGSTGDQTGSLWVSGSSLYWVDSNGEKRSKTGSDTGNNPSDPEGSIWLENGDFHYVDDGGNERVLN